MEQKEQQNFEPNTEKETNWGLIIAIVFLLSIVIGIRIYNYVLERQIATGLEKIMQKNIENHDTPFFEH